MRTIRIRHMWARIFRKRKKTFRYVWTGPNFFLLCLLSFLTPQGLAAYRSYVFYACHSTQLQRKQQEQEILLKLNNFTTTYITFPPANSS